MKSLVVKTCWTVYMDPNSRVPPGSSSLSSKSSGKTSAKGRSYEAEHSLPDQFM